MFPSARKNERRSALKQASRRPTVERLEGRNVPALFGVESHVNSVTVSEQFDSVTASSPNGQHVVVWAHHISVNHSQLRAQIYNASGGKVGPERILASVPDVSQPSVCMDNYGRFFVSYNRYRSGTDRDILVTRFSSVGVKLGTTIVAATLSDESDSSIACDGQGNFSVSYTVAKASNNRDIYARRYSSNGVFLGEIAVSATRGVNEMTSAIAVKNTSPAYISVVFKVNGNIYHKRYHPTGLLFNDMNGIAVSNLTEANPSVAVDALGTAVVAFQQYNGTDWNILARKVNLDGTMSATFTVQGGKSQDTTPTIAMDHSEGDLVVAYQSYQSVGNFYRVFVTELTPTGNVRTHYIASANTVTGETRPSVSINHLDGYIVSFTTVGIPGDPGLGILARFGSR